MNLGELKDKILSVNEQEVKLYFVTRALKPGMSKSNKARDKYLFVVYQIDCNKEIREYLHSATCSQIDKTVKNGYSLVGDFVQAGDFEENYDEGIYLDCNKEGTGKKTQQDYRLFRFSEGKVRLLDMVIDGENGWAVELWDAVEDELV